MISEEPSDLAVDDQAAIVEVLQSENIPYKLDPQANAILLPKEQVYHTRLMLAREGLPKGGGVGFEIFDQSDVGMSDFQQRVAFLRALEGELARTIGEIDDVEFAKVNIVIPKQRLFLEEQQPSTASVLVRLKPGATVNPEQVRAMVHLVAKSVEGLQPDQVTIVDSQGNVLSDMLSDDDFLFGSAGGQEVSSVQRELERRQEKEFERKLRIMLERVFGPGNVVVRVRVQLDFDKRRQNVTEYIPGPDGKGVVRSEQDMEESYVGPGNVPGAPPGTTTNIPGYAIAPEEQGQSEYNKEESTTNYEITTREEEVVRTPGSVEKLTASVLVNGDLEPEATDGLHEAVAAAIGLDEARGDKLVVQQMKFSTSFVDTMLAQLQEERRQKLIVGMIAIALVLAGAAAAAFWWMRRRRKQMREAGEGEGAGEGTPSLEEMMEHPEMMAGRDETAILEEQIRAYATKNPEDVAQVVQNWLSEE
ncbi:MAG: flagellar M-ring protein FliF [Synergistales bacterium]|nr:flagellar M-ring protein FliF [Synergistales bacterium]